jgi:hypothetical protein
MSDHAHGQRGPRTSYLPPIITLAVAGFVGLIVIFALDEYWDLPARSFGAMLKPIRPYEFSIKVVAALCLFITVLGVLREAIVRIKRLQHMLTMCAWCRRVSVDGEWLSIDQFLQQRKNTTSSIGVCPDCYGKKTAPLNADATASRSLPPVSQPHSALPATNRSE